MSALHKIQCGSRHVIAQVVKTELVVRTERDIARISLTTLVRIRFVLINTINRQAVEHIQRTIPLRVTFSQVIVHGHHMHTFVRHSVEEHRQRSHQSLTFTGCHLGYLTLMQNDTTKQLNIVVNHVPGDLVTTCNPVVMIYGLVALNLDEIKPRISSQIFIHLRCRNHYALVLSKTASCRFNDSISFRQDLVQHLFVVLLDLLLEFVHLVIDFLAFVYLEFLDIGLQLGNACFLVCHALCHFRHQRRAVRTEFVVTELVNLLVFSLDLVHHRLNSAHIFLRLVSK